MRWILKKKAEWVNEEDINKLMMWAALVRSVPPKKVLKVCWKAVRTTAKMMDLLNLFILNKYPPLMMLSIILNRRLLPWNLAKNLLSKEWKNSKTNKISKMKKILRPLTKNLQNVNLMQMLLNQRKKSQRIWMSTSPNKRTLNQKLFWNKLIVCKNLQKLKHKKSEVRWISLIFLMLIQTWLIMDNSFAGKS